MADRFFLNIGTAWNDTANWSTLTGGAGGASLPGSADRARFDVNSGNCNINANINVSGIFLEATYVNTVTQDNGFTITTGSADFITSGGTFLGGDSNITCTDRFTVGSGGLFTSTSARLQVTNTVSVSAGTYTHNNGLFRFINFFSTSFSWNGNTFYDLDFAVSNNTITTFSGDMIIANLFTATNLGGGHGGSGSFDCKGDIVTNSQNVSSSYRTVKINGTVPQQISAPGNGFGALGALQ